MDSRFEQFIKERVYLKNVSTQTVVWYRNSLRWLPNSSPTQAELNHTVVRMREAGLKPVSVNCRLRAINAFLRWSGSPLKVSKLKEERRVLPTFRPDDIKTVVRWKPKRREQLRTQMLMLLLVDTGTRISELLNLRWESVDFDNLLITVIGKGDKQRRIPFSFECRRFLWKFKQHSKFDLVFSTRNGTRLGIRNVERDVHRVCKTLRITAPPRILHSLRHTFALHYIKNGGNVFFLQRILGHTSLSTSRLYVNLQTEDLSRVHEQRTLLRGY